MTTFVIFGGSGDLSDRKLIPSLFNLYLDNHLTNPFSIVIFGRSKYTDESIRAKFLEGINKFSRRKSDKWAEFAQHIFYLQGDYEDPKAYEILKKKIEGEAIYYLATPPELFSEIPKRLKEANMTKGGKLIIEKPFGQDLESAKQLNANLLKYFDESQIFRIDHYLGKETVQNILAFRFANPFFEPIWNNNFIEKVEILAAEAVGVEDRGGYYDKSGALRDMVQNHLFQLLCLVGMEPILFFEANELRNKKIDVLKAIQPIPPQCAQRGQYKGYREEKGVAKDSTTETYAALKVFINNWRWEGVPFYLRTGKKLAEQNTKITVHFKKIPHNAFDQTLDKGLIDFLIQPQEKIIIQFNAKFPGPELLLKPVNLKFCYKDEFKVPIPEAYETLLFDVIKDDTTLFMRTDQVEAAWALLMPIINDWAKNKPADFPNYLPGSWGPKDIL